MDRRPEDGPMCRIAVAMLLLAGLSVEAAEPAKIDQRKALQPFNFLIAPWKGVGTPEGTREQKQNGFWTEVVSWQWQFEKDDAWLQVKFDQGRDFVRGELRGLGDDRYQYKLETKSGDWLTFEGVLKEKKL